MKLRLPSLRTVVQDGWKNGAGARRFRVTPEEADRIRRAEAAWLSRCRANESCWKFCGRNTQFGVKSCIVMESRALILASKLGA